MIDWSSMTKIKQSVKNWWYTAIQLKMEILQQLSSEDYLVLI